MERGIHVNVNSVYRRNGSAHDVSIEVCVTYCDSPIVRWDTKGFFNQEERTIVKAESPTDYCERGWMWSRGGDWETTRIAKYKAEGITIRKINTIIEKVKAAVDSFQLPDYSHVPEEDRANWHEDTTAEVRAWAKARKEACA